jgi:hypothetical protein
MVCYTGSRHSLPRRPVDSELSLRRFFLTGGVARRLEDIISITHREVKKGKWSGNDGARRASGCGLVVNLGSRDWV